MRVVAGGAAVVHAFNELAAGASVASAAPALLVAALGVLLIVGLWTPIVAALMVVLELWHVFSDAGNPTVCLLLATLSAGLVLLGPGAWSIDARLFGWKRLEIRNGNGKRENAPPS